MAKTHFGFETVDETEKAKKVAGVFTSVASKYDIMNDLMSVGLHRIWKRFAVGLANVHEGQRVLDIAGGSGDISRLFLDKVGKNGQVVLTDINNAMLRVGRDRLLDEGKATPTAQCDAEHLPFPDNYFDCVSIAFGLRNVTHKDAALREMHRVLKPGGRVIVLEFSKVAKPLEKSLRPVFLQAATQDGRAHRQRRGQLPLPRRIHPHASGTGRTEADDDRCRAGAR